jgi:hypothetical protein
MAFALWRYVPGFNGSPQVYFRFDFFIEADLAMAEALSERLALSRHALRRRADEAFPVDYRTVWLTSDLEIVRSHELLSILELPYVKQPRPDGSRDFNLRVDRWVQADKLVSIEDWSELILRAGTVANRLVHEDVGFRDYCGVRAKRAREVSMAKSDALASRITRLAGPARYAEEQAASEELRLSEAIVHGIEQPSIRVDSAGLVVLGSTMLDIQ